MPIKWCFSIILILVVVLKLELGTRSGPRTLMPLVVGPVRLPTTHHINLIKLTILIHLDIELENRNFGNRKIKSKIKSKQTKWQENRYDQ